MNNGTQKVIVILGQTATGKSDLAVQVAKKFKGEVISADSRQVYKGLNIGTGKITKKEMQRIPHHLLDVTTPRKQFSVQEYKTLADRKIKEILARGNVPIICGGTGFYIGAVVSGIVLPEVQPNNKLRKNLSRKTAEQLFKILKKLDRNRAETIDSKNKVRLIRAIEIVKTLGKVPKLTEIKPKYKFIKVGLWLPGTELKSKINKRLLTRIEAGMIKEAVKLHKDGLSWKKMEALGLEYRYLALYLQDKITKQAMVEKLNTEIYRYAKRQMTWFKRDKQTKWFKGGENNKVLKYLKTKV